MINICKCFSHTYHFKQYAKLLNFNLAPAMDTYTFYYLFYFDRNKNKLKFYSLIE